MIRIVTDSNVLLSAGMLSFALSVALDRFAGTYAFVDFVGGLLVGLSIGAFGTSVIMMARQAGSRE
jgi:hypothetical protein